MSVIKAIQSRFPLGFQWQTMDPFLFCAYHMDYYPEANDEFGPDVSLSGRRLGEDFNPKDGFRMYHGQTVPGFPVHPHRGFETITLVRKGYVDHADSLGAAGRYGRGDVQWMTAGSGLQHSEMFPLLDKKNDNTLELLQIWINLPRKNKMTAPGYKMFWSEEIPRVEQDQGKVTIDVIAGQFNEKKALSAPEASWASDPANEVALWLVEAQAKSSFKLPGSQTEVNRVLYFYHGQGAKLNGESISSSEAFVVDPSVELNIEDISSDSKFLLMQGAPISEPIVQHGPFVMNTKDEIYQAISDYQQTQFGGWPWDRTDMVHGDAMERFGKQADGTIEKPNA